MASEVIKKLEEDFYKDIYINRSAPLIISLTNYIEKIIQLVDSNNINYMQAGGQILDVLLRFDEDNLYDEISTICSDLEIADAKVMEWDEDDQKHAWEELKTTFNEIKTRLKT